MAYRVRFGRSAMPAIVVCVVAGLIFLTVVVLPQFMVSASEVSDPARRLELQNSVRTTLVQGLGAMLLAVGAFFTWRQIQLNREQLRQSLDSNTAQLKLSREGQVTEQFSRALEHLGHSNTGVRVGSIYALEQIAKTAPEMRLAIHELVAAYVWTSASWSQHDPTTYQAIEDVEDEPALLLRLRAADIQAAMTVLGRRIEVPGEILELQNVDLRVAYLGGATLRRAIIGRAMLAFADLNSADLSAAHLRRSNLRCANLTDARLVDANLVQTNLCGADLSGAELAGAVFEGAMSDNATTWPASFDWRAAGVIRET
jgi:Pentapeptide repeats (8 copies)